MTDKTKDMDYNRETNDSSANNCDAVLQEENPSTSDCLIDVMCSNSYKNDSGIGMDTNVEERIKEKSKSDCNDTNVALNSMKSFTCNSESTPPSALVSLDLRDMPHSHDVTHGDVIKPAKPLESNKIETHHCDKISSGLDTTSGADHLTLQSDDRTDQCTLEIDNRVIEKSDGIHSSNNLMGVSVNNNLPQPVGNNERELDEHEYKLGSRASTSDCVTEQRRISEAAWNECQNTLVDVSPEIGGGGEEERELDSTDAKSNVVETDSDSQMRTFENSDCETTTMKRKTASAALEEAKQAARDGEIVNSSEGEIRTRRRALRDLTPSDSDEFDDTTSMNSCPSNEEETTTADSDFVNKCPPNRWSAVPELCQRQIGSSNRTPASMFRERIMGSLRMVQRLTLMHKMEYHQGCVNALNFNRIGTLLASGSDDLNIVLWNWVQNKPALIYDSGHRGNVFQAKFMPFSGDCHIVSCARDGQVRLAELSLTGVCKATKKVAQHKSPAHKLALEYDSPHMFLSCGEDGNVFEIDLREDKPQKLLLVKDSGRRVPLYSIQTNPSNSLEFCVSGLDHEIRVYDKRKIGGEDVESASVKKYCPHHLLNASSKANITCACYNYNGTEIVGTYNDENIYLFSCDHSSGADYIHKYEGHRNNSTVKGVNFYGPRSEYIISGSDCGNVYMWDKETEAIVQYLHADDTGVVNVSEAHPFAPILATSGLDSDIKVWAPIAQDATALSGIHKVTKKNRKDREYRQGHDSDSLFNSQILSFLIRQSARAARGQRAPDDDTDSSPNDNSDDSDASDDDDDDDDASGPPHVHLLSDHTRCVPS